MRRKRQIVMVTRDYRLTIIDDHWTAAIEKADGFDLMNTKRWRKVKSDEITEGLLNDIVGDVALNLLNRKKRRNRK